MPTASQDEAFFIPCFTKSYSSFQAFLHYTDVRYWIIFLLLINTEPFPQQCEVWFMTPELAIYGNGAKILPGNQKKRLCKQKGPPEKRRMVAWNVYFQTKPCNSLMAHKSYRQAGKQGKVNLRAKHEQGQSWSKFRTKHTEKHFTRQGWPDLCIYISFISSRLWRPKRSNVPARGHKAPSGSPGAAAIAGPSRRGSGAPWRPLPPRSVIPRETGRGLKIKTLNLP